MIILCNKGTWGRFFSGWAHLLYLFVNEKINFLMLEMGTCGSSDDLIVAISGNLYDCISPTIGVTNLSCAQVDFHLPS